MTALVPPATSFVRPVRLTSSPVIALRRTIEQGVRHPLLGPLCLILLALLLFFTVVHGAHDQIHEGELVVCIAFLITVLVSLALPQLLVVRITATSSSRAPPVAAVRPRTASSHPFRAVPVPLRL